MAALSSSSSASAADRDTEEIAFLDVETSAPPPPYVLLEFGAIVICSRRLVDVSCYATLVRPADPSAAVPDPTARWNGITRGAVADAPPFRDVADKVYDVLHGEQGCFIVLAVNVYIIIKKRKERNTQVRVI